MSNLINKNHVSFDVNSREEIIESITKSLRPDLRSVKWEYKVILDSMQICNPCVPKELLDSINEKYKSSPDLMSYNSLYNNLRALSDMGVIRYNPLKKEYSLDESYVQIRYQFLPTSNYNILFFTISVAGLIWSSFNSYMVQTFSIVVIVGLFYLLGQHLGTEFKWKR